MPRKREPRSKTYRKYDNKELAPAISAVQKGMSFQKAAVKYDVPKSVLYRHFRFGSELKSHGGQTSLSQEEENIIVDRISTCADWGYPLDMFRLRLLVKGYLDRKGVKVAKFKNNMPGRDFAEGFLRRHSDKIRLCQNIKRSRANVSRDSVNHYFDELEKTLMGVPPSHIVNYDETNLTDDPGRKKVIARRGMKYPERVINSSKASISIMFAASGDGSILPPYTVYKSVHLHDSWRLGGPKGLRYNRSESGWFDADCFDDWVKSVVIPYFKTLPPGKKILIGDYLSSRLSETSIYLCKAHEIRFVFLPPNSTHMMQPLDVAFFALLEKYWRQILLDFKQKDGKNNSSIPKERFPSLLKQLMNELEDTGRQNVISGFRKCGIIPLNRQEVLNPEFRIPAEDPQDKESAAAAPRVDAALIGILKELRGTDNAEPKAKRRRLSIVPGRSAGMSDSSFDQDEDEFERPTSPEESSDEESTGNHHAPSVNRKAKPKSSVPGLLVYDGFEIKPSDWLLTSFEKSTKKPGTSRSKKAFYIGKVLSVEEDNNKFYEVSFLRRKNTKKEEEELFSYSFPEISDVCVLTSDQIEGKLPSPKESRRGIKLFPFDCDKL